MLLGREVRSKGGQELTSSSYTAFHLCFGIEPNLRRALFLRKLRHARSSPRFNADLVFRFAASIRPRPGFVLYPGLSLLSATLIPFYQSSFYICSLAVLTSARRAPLVPRNFRSTSRGLSILPAPW